MLADTPAFKIVSLGLRSVCLYFVLFCLSLATYFLAPGSLSLNVYKLTKLVKGTQKYWHRDKTSVD